MPGIESIYFQSWVVPVGICILGPQSVFTGRMHVGLQGTTTIKNLKASLSSSSLQGTQFFIPSHIWALHLFHPSSLEQRGQRGFAEPRTSFQCTMYFIFLLPLTNSLKSLSESFPFSMGVKHFFFSSFNLDPLQACSAKVLSFSKWIEKNTWNSWTYTQVLCIAPWSLFWRSFLARSSLLNIPRR